MTEENLHFDVLIVGAGLSGVSAAYHLQTRCPTKRYAILEGRERLGGTWDLFRYPGIRSDSDMYTLGYSFRPWTNPKAIADGPDILAYIRETAEAYGIDEHIRFQKRAVRARWSSEEARWSVEVLDGATGETEVYTAGFVYMCSGYYDYDAGYTPEFEGRERFEGLVVHPQKWPEGLDVTGKRVVVIGSGATAVTLVPALAKTAAHVTMLQRSPTYVLSVPARDRVADWLRARVSDEAAYDVVRWKNVLVGMSFYAYCRRFPAHAKGLLVGLARKALGGDREAAQGFTPRYDPWDQRLCMVPDGDLFDALRAGSASVVTDRIARFTERGLELESGARLDADIVVTATGLSLKFLGGMKVEVDGKDVEPAKTMTYKGMMCGDVPNLALAVGYTNASWTLKCDLTSEYVCRLINHMDARGYSACYPHNDDPTVREIPLLDFSAGYVLRALDRLPKQGSRAPWRLYQNYVLDRVALRHAAVDDGVMRFTKRATVA
ncbi:MAG: NAD(P)/FAD-dependent oxidoreductase [Polyangiales bacterium]